MVKNRNFSLKKLADSEKNSNFAAEIYKNEY